MGKEFYSGYQFQHIIPQPLLGFPKELVITGLFGYVENTIKCSANGEGYLMKTNTTFLSFADPDRELAKQLSQLFDLMGEYAYFAAEDLGRAGTPGWRKEIIKQIKNSGSFLPIYTRHSIGRPWVLFESGVADSFGLKRFPARVSSVSPEEIDYLPSGSAFYYDLSTETGVIDLITNVCKKKGGDNAEITAKVRRECQRNSEFVKRIIVMAKTRWAFIAGNIPRGIEQPESEVKWYTTQADYEAKLREFCESLTESLLNNGFSIAACPQVRSVGMPVTRKALSCLDAKEDSESVKFRISGIFPIDREARELTLSETAKKKWLDHIVAFRKTYLADQEWLILVGVNEGTLEEFEVASQCNVKICAVPCFGGTAKKIFDRRNIWKAEPCTKCTNRDGHCNLETIAKMVVCLKTQGGSSIRKKK
jgi:hypothetical protein